VAKLFSGLFSTTFGEKKNRRFYGHHFFRPRNIFFICFDLFGRKFDHLATVMILTNVRNVMRFLNNVQLCVCVLGSNLLKVFQPFGPIPLKIFQINKYPMIQFLKNIQMFAVFFRHRGKSHEFSMALFFISWYSMQVCTF
jgi:hypothetical protein